MATFERRSTERRAAAPKGAISLGAALPAERRARHNRREQPRRRADVHTIAHFARHIAAGQTRLEVIVDGNDGLRLVAMFQCGCIASEPIGAGASSLRIETCAGHQEPPVTVERRRGRR